MASIARRLFTTSACRRASAAEASTEIFERFGNGKPVSIRKQILDANQLQLLSITLNRTPSSNNPPPEGTPIPAGYHLVYFTPSIVESELGLDGTDRTVNPLAPYTRLLDEFVLLPRFLRKPIMHGGYRPVSLRDEDIGQNTPELSSCAVLSACVPPVPHRNASVKPDALVSNQSCWIDINNIWDRIEKALYLLIDAFLNFYFIRVVRANLVRSGLEKYNKLVLFNKYMIVISLLMDVMIIAAMWFPNGFVYAIFHPLAYLVKLNIEMSMAHLIKKIATDRSSTGDTFIISNSHTRALQEKRTHDTDSLPPSRQTMSILKGMFSDEPPKSASSKNEILRTEEFKVHSRKATDLEMQQQRPEGNIYDGSSFISKNDSLARCDVDWRESHKGEQDSSSVNSLRDPIPTDEETHITRSSPVVLHPV
ncbi:hypothetical protein E8E13_011615 [Curvularia kusanoi]|uniref:Uncharacterized protein n=1 Tax=Curvularia kusanoi TaxID=90978 RepID=A0A9P4WEU2_CURKU|nr:hypothetical protein E8E13_011615 [Curvularia kusanoi]